MTQLSDIKIDNDYIVVVQKKLKHSVSAGGIILNEINKWQDTLTGTVVAISENSPYPLTVKVGDTLYFTEKEVKSKIHLNGKEYLFVPEKDALGYERE